MGFWTAEDPVSVLCSLLADEHCRQVIEYLRSGESDRATVDELAEQAAAGDGSSVSRKRAELRLHHVTLPKLDAAGAVEYDPQQRHVRYTGRREVEALLGTVGGDDPAED